MSLEAEDKYKQAMANYVGARKSKYATWDAYVNAKNASPYNGEAVKQAKDNYYAASDAFKQSKAELVGAKAALKKSKQNPESSGTQNTESSGTQNTESSGTQNPGTQNTETTDTQNTEQKSESAVSGAAKAIEEGGKKIGLSDSFYRDIGAAIKGQPTGNTLDAAAATAAAQSKNLQNDAARREMEGQRAQQVANRNVYGEAGKIASMQNDAQSRQNVQNISFTAGNAAALKRANNAPDVQAQIARQDQQQNVANERREQADTQTQAATEMEGNKKQFQIKSRDHDSDMNDSSRLSLGEGGGTSETQQTQDQQTQDQQTQDQQTQDQQTQDQQTQDQQTQDQQTQPEPEPEPEQTQEPISGNPQHVINGLLGSSKGQDLRSGEGGDDKALYDWAIQQGVTPLKPGKQKSQNPNDWEQEFIEVNGAKGQEVIQKLREGRAMPGNDASTNFDASNYDQMNKSMQVPSDARVKNVRSLVDCLSDIRMKHIKEDFDNYGRCSSKDFDWLLRRIGKLKYNDREYDPFNEADWEDDTDSSVLNAYADHIRNYVYTYKPEAVEIDSRIDPEQEHIGPMAQDIEQVNPACVKETADGVKTVDSARLAMMNAGAIGELARQLNELNMKFKALGL